MSFFNPKVDVLKTEDYKKLSLGDQAELGFKQGSLWRNYSIKDTLITTAGVGAAAGTAAVVAKSPKAQQAIMNVLKKAGNSSFVKNASASLSKLADNKYIQKGINWISKLPTAAKVAGVSILALTGIARRIHKNNTLEKNGALVQQSIDAKKAKDNIKD